MIIFDQVSKQFGTGDFGVKDLNFTIQPGELVVITGPSGSGKTTIMRLLTGDYTPSQGEITFDGESLTTLKTNNIHRLRRKIGVVFQDYKLLTDLNIWENIALALQILGKSQAEIEERVTDLLNLVQMQDKAFLFPSQLSGGEAQRVSIARALATAPSVIFADEPTGNLDPHTSLAIAKLLHKINLLGTTVMLATHDPNVIEFLADSRHLVLEKGEITQDSGTSNSKDPSHHGGTKSQIPNSKIQEPSRHGETKNQTKNSKSDDVSSQPIPDTKSADKIPDQPLTQEVSVENLDEELAKPKAKKSGLKLPKLWSFKKKSTPSTESELPPTEDAL